jgi:DNA-binding CsgD family transcriptional regulator
LTLSGQPDKAASGAATDRLGIDRLDIGVDWAAHTHAGLLVERERELERIGACLARAQHGRGGVTVVEGPAGIGKTVLLAAGRRAAEGRGFRVLRARGAELEREFAFGVVRQLVEAVVVRASEEERASLLAGPPGVAAQLLNLPGAGARLDGTAPVVPDPSFAVLHGLYWLCANMAAERPLALVVDDVHWADRASLRYLMFLLPRLEELRIAVLLGARPAEAGEGRELLASLTTDPGSDVIRVGPLTSRGVATLVAAGLEVAPDPQFVQACAEATGGTPFLVHTLIDALHEGRILPIASSADKVQNVATATLDRWVMLRLVHLGPDAARLARAVAVLERAELDQAIQLAELDFPAGARAADLLVRAGLLDATPLGFVHPLLRGAVYRDIGISDRPDVHGRAARLLAESQASPARVAEHLLATIPAARSWTVEQLRAAARDATKRGAPESAAAYLRRAVAEPPPVEIRSDMLLELGMAEFGAGQPDWYAHLEQAVQAAGNDATRIAAALRLANALRWHERSAEAVEVCDAVAARIAGDDPANRLTLEAMAVACGVLSGATPPSAAARSRALLIEATERAIPRHVLAVAAFAAVLGNQPADQAAGLARRAIDAGPRALPHPDEPPWFPYAVPALLWAECYDEAQVLLDAAVAEARAAGNGLVLPAVLGIRASLALRRGDLTAAEADARALLDAPGPPAPPLQQSRAASVLVDVLVERGALDEAWQTFAPLAADPVGTSRTLNMPRHARGRLLFAQGRYAQALGEFRAAGEVAISGLAPSPTFLAWRSDAALAALAVGDLDLARHLSDEELDLAHVFGASRALGVALRVAGLVAGGARGEALMREAVEVLEGPHTRLERARALVDLGAFLRRSNRRVDARQLLRQALDIAHHLGAATLARRAETELRATGARPRRVLLSGLEALTASELRIAELAAEGLTNREIAQTLFITAGTVEGHLTRVFTKLGVTARRELRAALLAPTQADRA